jgi:UDP-2-acetamido-3-amino-2,3-dideoxy-glucuronate N-acetyltransferase
MKIKEFKLNNIKAPNFLMTPLELKDFVDFKVKRIYFISGVRGKTGAHCHKKEEELFILIQGSCIACFDEDGKGIEEIRMEAPQKAIYVPAYTWHNFKNFSKDAILLAISSTNYNSNREDYIEDYEEFKKVKNKIGK